MRNVLFVDVSQRAEDDFVLFKTGQNVGFSFAFKSNTKSIADSILRNLGTLTSELFEITVDKITSHAQRSGTGIEAVSELSLKHFSRRPEIFVIDYKTVVLKDLLKNIFLKNLFKGKNAHIRELNAIFKRARQEYFKTLRSAISANGYSKQRGENQEEDANVDKKSGKKANYDSRAYYIGWVIEILLHLLVLAVINYMSFCRVISGSRVLLRLQKLMNIYGQTQAESWIKRIRHEPALCTLTINFLSVILFKSGLKATYKVSFLLRNSLKPILSLFKFTYKFIWRKFKDFYLLINDLYYSPQIKVRSLGNILFE